MYEMISHWSSHGKLVCPHCIKNNKAFTLINGGKVFSIITGGSFQVIIDT